jgi:phosphoribosylglycinamide formyltransferase 1
MKRIAVFASGSGTNAQKIIEHFLNHEKISVSIIFTNNEKAKVIERAKMFNLPCIIFNRKQFYESEEILGKLKEHQIDFVVLAGFLWLVPVYLIRAFAGRMINIHPALLPKYGGKGMYGMKVHEAIVENNEQETGITIHYVNEEYDKGSIIFQAKCPVNLDDTAESVAAKIHELEHRHFPHVVEKLVSKM